MSANEEVVIAKGTVNLDGDDWAVRKLVEAVERVYPPYGLTRGQRVVRWFFRPYLSPFALVVGVCVTAVIGVVA